MSQHLLLSILPALTSYFWGSRGNSHMEHIRKFDQHPFRDDFSQRNGFC